MMGYGERSEKKFGMTKFLSLSRDRDRDRDSRSSRLWSLLALPSACAGVHASISEG